MTGLAEVHHMRGQMMLPLPCLVAKRNALVNAAQLRTDDAWTSQRRLHEGTVGHSFSKRFGNGSAGHHTMDLAFEGDLHMLPKPFVQRKSWHILTNVFP